jgi:hypothetical protein
MGTNEACAAIVSALAEVTVRGVAKAGMKGSGRPGSRFTEH